jgi:hypothetical protein
VVTVSVINYKGGVGKTTLTANLGAELAFRGNRVLLIDLDPQASLTFSFYETKYWRDELAGERTLLKWFGSVVGMGEIEPLARYVLTPPRVTFSPRISACSTWTWISPTSSAGHGSSTAAHPLCASIDR